MGWTGSEYDVRAGYVISCVESLGSYTKELIIFCSKTWVRDSRLIQRSLITWNWFLWKTRSHLKFLCWHESFVFHVFTFRGNTAIWKPQMRRKYKSCFDVYLQVCWTESDSNWGFFQANTWPARSHCWDISQNWMARRKVLPLRACTGRETVVNYFCIWNHATVFFREKRKGEKFFIRLEVKAERRSCVH